MILGYNILRLKSWNGFTLSPSEYTNYKIKLKQLNMLKLCANAEPCEIITE